ncbi:MAG: alpha-D-glucose phosphate-specific phosphoglucomutase [Pseudomonadales bacterium]|nr:alpha-D-glucose phosphate-specific phosphoglucomutase [Pseudomonadales bacterium]
MSAVRSPLAGKPAPSSLLINVRKLIDDYAGLRPDVLVAEQRVSFGTSGHRGSSSSRSFNEWHVWAISQAICDFRKHKKIVGPLFIGRDTHALSQPAFESVLEVLAANGVVTLIAAAGEYTPTPAVSHAILAYNRSDSEGLADGIIITPSHNPPDSGGIKYNPPHGGPADTVVTSWIESRANILLSSGLLGLRRLPFTQALRASTTREHRFMDAYISDLCSVLDFDVIRGSGVRMAVDPLGGAGVHYWAAIAEHFRLNLTVLNEVVDPTFAFMSVDRDGKIRMDPSSSYAMQCLIHHKDQFDVSFACDTDHDRHGIVCPGIGLLPANQYLVVAIDYLIKHRPGWALTAAVGKTVVSSSMIDKVCARGGRQLYEVPVGFKWFVDGLLHSRLVFAGEESAGATFSRRDGRVWTTDKDGMVAALLSAEITGGTGLDPGMYYGQLATELGEFVTDRMDVLATPAQKKRLMTLSASQIHVRQLAGENIEQVLSHAPGNEAAIGGIKVMTAGGWFAARPSGTEDIYRIYAESMRGVEHLHVILREAQAIIDTAMMGAADDFNVSPCSAETPPEIRA